MLRNGANLINLQLNFNEVEEGIREVQAMLGHERISSTERYTHVVKEDLKRIVLACHPAERSLNDG